MANRKSLALLVAAAVAAGALMWPAPALAHGARDYSVIEFHYMRIGPFTYPVPYAQHLYYCDGHYEFTPGPGGSLGLAYTQTIEINEC